MIEYQFTFKHWFSLGILLIAIIIASVEPLELSSYFLHQIGTALMLIVLLISFKKFGLSFYSFFSYILFLLIHILGAHYLYSYVPYNEWIIQIFHVDLNQSMGWTRNMYDRLVHFAYGLLLYPFCHRLFKIWLLSLKPWILFVLIVQFIMASSLIYEWIEWWIAIGLSPEAAENYNGQQGDIWDAHKDMFLATIGAVITATFILFKDRQSHFSK